MSSDQGSSISSFSGSESEHSAIDYNDELRSDDENDLPFADNDGLQEQKNSDDEMEQSEAIQVDPEEAKRLLMPHRKVEDPEQSDQQIPPQERLTSNIVTKYEYTKLVGLRAKEISKCSVIYVDLSEEELKTLTPIQIAEKEFQAKVMPYILKRVHPSGGYELWDLSEMEGYQEMFKQM